MDKEEARDITRAYICWAADNGRTALFNSAFEDFWNEYNKPKTVVINGVELEDDRIANPLEIGDTFWVEYYDPTENEYTVKWTWEGCVYDLNATKNKTAHRTKKGAEAFVKARFNL